MWNILVWSWELTCHYLHKSLYFLFIFSIHLRVVLRDHLQYVIKKLRWPPCSAKPNICLHLKSPSHNDLFSHYFPISTFAFSFSNQKQLEFTPHAFLGIICNMHVCILLRIIRCCNLSFDVPQMQHLNLPAFYNFICKQISKEACLSVQGITNIFFFAFSGESSSQFPKPVGPCLTKDSQQAYRR